MEYAKCLSRLQRLCSRAEYCSGDIYRKALKDLEGDAEAAARVVASLREERYVDDARYAAAFAREKASLQGWGPVKIRFQLRGKGVSEADIATALADIDTEKADARLEKLLTEKLRSLEGDPQCKLKLIKYALSRGYDYEKIATFVARMAGRSVAEP
jgi:regulatory protein